MAEETCEDALAMTVVVNASSTPTGTVVNALSMLVAETCRLELNNVMVDTGRSMMAWVQ